MSDLMMLLSAIVFSIAGTCVVYDAGANRAAEPKTKCESSGQAWTCTLRPFVGSDGLETKRESCACVNPVLP